MSDVRSVRSGARRKQGALTQKVYSLEQHAADLSTQLKQLQLQNDSSRRRAAALAAICSVTHQAINTIQRLGSAAPGIAAPASHARGVSVAKIDACIDITLRDQPWNPLLAAHVPPPPLCWPSTADAPLAQQVADGGPLALLKHFLCLLQQYPQQFGWVQRQTPETARDMLYLIQGVIQYIHNMSQLEGDQCRSGSGSKQSTNTGINGISASRTNSGNSTSSSGSVPPQLACDGGGSSAAAVPPGLAAAAAGGVAAAVSVGGGRALGATLAFLEVAGRVHDALLAQQEQEQQQQQQQASGQACSGCDQTPAQQQLVEAWAQALLAAAQHSCWGTAGSRGTPAASATAGADKAAPPDEEGGLSDVDCALLGAVMGVLSSLQIVFLCEPGRIIEWAAASMRPVGPAQLQAITQSMRCSPGQLREVLWASALYQDLRKQHFEEQTKLEELVGEVLATLMQQQGQPPAEGGQAEPAEAAAAAPAAAAADREPMHVASGAGKQEGGMPLPPHRGDVGGDGSPDPEMLRHLCEELQGRARLNFWWESLQFSHVTGMLSLRQVSSLIIGMAPAGPSPPCWGTRLLLALLQAQQSRQAAAGAKPAGKRGAAAAADPWAAWLEGQTKGRGRSQYGKAVAAQPWVPLPAVVVPPHLLQAEDQLPHIGVAAASPAATPPASAAAGSAETPGEQDHSGAGTMSAAGPSPSSPGDGDLSTSPVLPAAPGVAVPWGPAAAAAVCSMQAPLDNTTLGPPGVLPTVGGGVPGCGGAASASCPPQLPSDAHPGGGWMAWLAAPSGPLGPDAAQYMPLVAAAQMSSAAGGQAAALAGPAAAAGGAAGPALQGAHHAAVVGAPPDDAPRHTPQVPLLYMDRCDAPHSPVPPDLFEQCLGPAAELKAPLLPPASHCLAHHGGDGPDLLPIDPSLVRPELMLPDNSLLLLEQLMGGWEEPTVDLLADILV